MKRKAFIATWVCAMFSVIAFCGCSSDDDNEIQTEFISECYIDSKNYVILEDVLKVQSLDNPTISVNDNDIVEVSQDYTIETRAKIDAKHPSEVYAGKHFIILKHIGNTVITVTDKGISIC